MFFYFISINFIFAFNMSLSWFSGTIQAQSKSQRIKSSQKVDIQAHIGVIIGVVKIKGYLERQLDNVRIQQIYSIRTCI